MWTTVLSVPFPAILLNLERKLSGIPDGARAATAVDLTHMQRCTQCNGSLKRDETSCFVCGAPVPEECPKSPFRERCRVAIKIAFYFSLALTIASLFTSLAPSFIKCSASTAILLLVKNSADQMAEANRS
jgi:hypothetical protein